MEYASWEIAFSGIMMGVGGVIIVQYALFRKKEISTSQAGLGDLKKMAHEDCVKSQYHIGYLYEMGIDAPKNPSKGFYWYCRAAANGHRGATAKVARCYLDGIGVNESLEEGLWWMAPGNARIKRKRAKSICRQREGEFKKSLLRDVGVGVLDEHKTSKIR